MILGKPHVVLLGDSSFDNQSYVQDGENDVTGWLNVLVDRKWNIHLGARDGAITQGVTSQYVSLPRDIRDNATHVVVSIGGNDALGNIDLLKLKCSNGAEFLAECSVRAQEFEVDYVDMLLRMKAATDKRNQRLVVCTIYQPNFEDDFVRNIGIECLKIFNDIIIKSAVNVEVDVIDQRQVYTMPEDYANDIEPSTVGSRKIALAIVNAVRKQGGITVFN